MAAAVIACTSVGMGSGCTMLSGLHQAVADNDCVDDFMVSYRNRAWSAKAWHREKARFCNQKHLADFRAGFRAGYESVASGGPGCVPPLAPESYWGWEYQSPEGQAKVSAWFAGFPLGAKAAEEDGIGYWSEIRTTLPMPVATLPACAVAGPSPLDGGPTPVDPATLGTSAIGGVHEAVPAPPAGGVVVPAEGQAPAGELPGPASQGRVDRSPGGLGPGGFGPGGLGTIDIDSLNRVPASSVPTAASGR